MVQGHRILTFWDVVSGALSSSLLIDSCLGEGRAFCGAVSVLNSVMCCGFCVFQTCFSACLGQDCAEVIRYLLSVGGPRVGLFT